jgi:hypothetical protein
MKRIMLAAALAAAAPAALAEMGATTGGHMDHAHAAAPACAEPKPQCAATAEPVFAKDGALWIAYSVGDAIYAASSRDKGKSFGAPSVIAKAQNGVIDANGEARPKIVALDDGTLVASYTTRPEKSYSGSVFLTRSTDGGKSFSAPQKLLDGDGQRFDVFALSPKGRLYFAWLDKADADTTKAQGKEFAGSGVAVGWSDDAGATFSGKKILMDHSCECCRIGAAFDRDGLPVFAWRHVFEGNMRDHYVAKLSADGASLAGGRVSEDQWATTCPHHGPSLAIDASGAWHVVWYARGKARQGLFYAQSRDGGKSFTAPEKFGDDARAPSHAFILAAKDGLNRVWKEFDGETTRIMRQYSADAGASWSAPLSVAETKNASDHPLLLAHKGASYLSWLSRDEGYRLLPLAKAAAAAPKRARAAQAGAAAQ